MNDLPAAHWLGLLHFALVCAGLLVYVLSTHAFRRQRQTSSAVAWVIALATVPYAALPLYLFFGARKLPRPSPVAFCPLPACPRDHATQRLTQHWAVQLTASMNLCPPEPCEQLLWHTDGTDALAALHRLIDHAQARLDISTFILADDRTGRDIVARLVHAARRGVAIRVLIDGIGSMATPWTLLAPIRRAGGQTARFLPLLRRPFRGRSNLRNHRKLAIADGRILWSGGRNLADEYFREHHGQPAWVDASFTLSGGPAGIAQQVFERDWAYATQRPEPATTSGTAAAASARAGYAQFIPSGPDHADDTLHSLLLTGCFRAQRRILAITPYFVPDDALLTALELAARRGVEVRIILPAHSNHPLADLARHRGLRRLSHAGAHLRLYPDMLHAKALVFDDEIALCGSANLDMRSLFLNFEAMGVFYDPAQIAPLAAWLARLDTLCTPYDARTPGLARDLLEGLILSLAFQL
jgi:cardiolipin synthase